MKLTQIKQRIKLFVTPKLLRTWANGMERQWPKLNAGASVIYHDFPIDDNIDLTICYNQDEMDREYKNEYHTKN